MSKLTVERIIKRFNLEVINKEEADITKEISVRSLNRLGVELATEETFLSNCQYVIVWGSKESNYLNRFNKEERIKKLRNVLSKENSAIILSIKFDSKLLEELKEVANEYRIPIIQTNIHLSEVNSTIGTYIVNHLAESKQVHGSLVKINGVGVLIIGKSGVGKSEAILSLIQQGNQFIADDAVVIKRVGRRFIGEVAEQIQDLLEARGIGIMNIKLVYGSRVMLESTQIDLVVELINDKNKEFNRLPDNNLKYDILGASLPLYEIPVVAGRSTATLIEAAVNVFIQRKKA